MIIHQKIGKLKTYPYSFLRVSNNAGQEYDYKFENFYVENQPNYDNSYDFVFMITGIACEGGSVQLTPMNYGNNIAQLNYGNIDEGLVLGKYPTFSWASDNFTNWLTQNGVNIALSLGLGLASGGALAGARTCNRCCNGNNGRTFNNRINYRRNNWRIKTSIVYGINFKRKCQRGR